MGSILDRWGRVSFVAISETMDARAGVKHPRLGAGSTVGKRERNDSPEDAVKRVRRGIDSGMNRADHERCGMVEGRGVEPPTPTLRT